ncbi:MAG: glycosyltransferase [Nitrospiraceae bacterium]|nr:MAG: glycosyltransferase [Nitrospiraceae bacterium]
MRLENFICDSSGIYKAREEGTPAGYMDGAESYLLDVLDKSRDLSIFSSELKSAIRDWPSLYHLSPYRNTILDCLELSDRDSRVLELGAGCGAITRWLGENFKEVCSIEGGLHRAKVAHMRCHDLDNVDIHVANFLDLKLSDMFDIATLIGVLEYSHMYHPVLSDSPFRSALYALELVYNALRDSGICILAIENKFGLKYFSGSREDHSGRVFDSIQGYPRLDSAVTFSSAEIEDLLRMAGFSSFNFYLPFPDYKLASTIINGEEITAENYLHNWIETPFKDRCSGQRTMPFNESLVTRELIKGRMLKDLSNSFLVVAYKGDQEKALKHHGIAHQSWIAKHYSLDRNPSYCKKVTLTKAVDGTLVIENTHAVPVKDERLKTSDVFKQKLSEEIFHRGDQLLFTVFKIMTQNDADPKFLRLLESLNQFLLDNYSSDKEDTVGIPLLKGEAYDITFWNIIVEESTGKWRVIDREWIFNGLIPVDFIIWRNLFHLILRYNAYFPEPFDHKTAKIFTIQCIRNYYPTFDEKRYDQSHDMDDYFQHYVEHGTLPCSLDQLPVCMPFEQHHADHSELLPDSAEHTNKNHEEVVTYELVSIIIPVHNKIEFTIKCIENLARNTAYEPYEVIIIDNASSDGTREFLGSLEGDVKIISNATNLGFAISNNQGAKKAKGEYLLFLNNDTIPQPGWLESMVKVMKIQQDVAVVGSKLIYPDNTIQHAGVVFDISDSALHIAHLYKGFDRGRKEVNHIREMNAVTAACMLVKKNFFITVGMFDEGFLNGYEDIDFCLRVREMGYKIIYTPESELYHYEETTEGRLLYGARNSRHFLNKWKEKIKPDIQDKAKEDGFRIEYTPDNRSVYIKVDAGEDHKERSCETDDDYKSYSNKDGQYKMEVHKDAEEARKIAIVRGANLNKWEMQNYEPMLESFDLKAFTSDQTNFDISNIEIPVVQLPSKHQGLLMEMEGLEDALADTDLVFSADITYKFSAQAVYAKQQYGCKVICLEWENIPYNYEEYEEVHHIKETVRKGADHFIAATDRAKEALMIEGVAEDRIDVIPMGVDLNVFRPVRDDFETEREKTGINSNDIVVLFIGRMVWEKGIYDFLNAAAKICRDTHLNDKQIKFILVGKGPELQGARERAGALGISGSTIFIEEYPYDDMYKLYNMADLFVLPSISTRSWQEQFGMVLIESMACGTPVISTYSGSIPEVVGDAGKLVQPNDHLSLYMALNEMIVNDDLRHDLGKRALKRAKNKFDAKMIADKVKAVFDKVMSRKNESDLLRESHEISVKDWEQGDKDKAFSLVCEIFGKDQDNKNVLDSVISMGMELEQYDKVEESIKEFLLCHPANLGALTSLSEVFIRTGREEQAEKELRKVLIFDTQNRRAHVLLDQIKENRSSVDQLR